MTTSPLSTILEDLLTCPICKDIFDDPQVLQCQHSLCNTCVKAMFRLIDKTSQTNTGTPRQITCPVCRAISKPNQIKTDFKTKSFLDTSEALYDSGLEGFASRRKDQCVKLCDLCRKKPVKKECGDCDRLLCEVCCDAHKAIPACKSHTLYPLYTHITSKQKEKLSAVTNKLQYLLNIVWEKRNIIESHEQDNEKICAKLLKTADKWKQKNITETSSKHHKEITEKILKIKDEEMHDILELKKGMIELEAKIKAKMQTIRQTNQENNTAIFIGEAERILHDFKAFPLSHDLSSIPDKIKHSKLFHIELSTSKNSESNKGLVMKIYKRTKSTNPLQYLFSSTPTVTSYPFPRNLQSNAYQTSLQIKTFDFVKQVLFHEGSLWCLYENHIDVYNIEGTWVRSINSEKIWQANGVTGLYNELVVACMGLGLVVFKLTGKFSTVIKDGAFCDVTTDHKKHIYALEYNNNTPTIVTYSRDYLFHKWSQIQCIKLPYSNLNPCNTIQWNGNFLLTTSCNDEQGIVYRYHLSGILLETYEREGSIPRMCCADVNTGDVIVTDSVHNHMSVFNVQGQTEVIDLGFLGNGTRSSACEAGSSSSERSSLVSTSSDTNSSSEKRYSQPFSVTVDEEQGIWVSFNDPKTIIRFMAVPVATDALDD